ncbi:beta-lactamase superfamily II metal-dependent hydrolase [Natranaerovirga pectinivora]|uniref:Beta-lactamase superfamily II metal-dependent hydrolase n=1 Tax=Natranaerovirga pectinivora TaxID=682400 RepID=A0A4R3MGY5_9FIRM|nr:MBL fold metallo-hydrolase [Natranaerovirga pectinivora]TCT11629.1 beta-lactamase superfamily II metal-dependent hydrolase [Natranaerovirga pectinivora]
MKRLRCLLNIMGIIMFIMVLTGCNGHINNGINAAGDLKIHFIDVGQGDAILIQQENYNMLIDAGDNKYGERVVTYLKSQGISKLDYVLGTHPHADHIGGLDDVINEFEIEKVLLPRVSHNTKTFEDVLIAIDNKNLQITPPNVGDNYILGDAKWTILAPINDKYSNLNDYSIVIRLEYGNKAFLFVGDAEEISEREMIELHGSDLKADVLKISHHGSSSSTTKEFLTAVNPTYGIIQVGEDNKYGHPHKEVMERLKTFDVYLYRTDLHGTIILTSDGKNIDIKTDNRIYKDKVINKDKLLPEEPMINTQYIGNKNSNIFHRDSCSSLPSEQNRIYYDTRDKAIEEGQTPCQRCKP